MDNFDFGKNSYSLQKKVMKLRKKEGLTLKQAWRKVLRKSPGKKSPLKKLKVKKMIAGKKRTVYRGINGGHFYRSKGRKVYIKD